MSPATNHLQIPTPTPTLIATAHNQQAVSARVAAMDTDITMDGVAEMEREKRRERQVRMHTRKFLSRNRRTGRQKPSHRITRAADRRIRRTQHYEHES